MILRKYSQRALCQPHLTECRRYAVTLLAEVVLIDTPGSRQLFKCGSLIHWRYLITPLNDSFVDFWMCLATVDPRTFEVTRHQPLIPRWCRRRARRHLDQASTDWIVLAESTLDDQFSRHKSLIGGGLQQLFAIGLICRCIEGLAERVIFPRTLSGDRRPSMMSMKSRSSVRPTMSQCHASVGNAKLLGGNPVWQRFDQAPHDRHNRALG